MRIRILVMILMNMMSMMGETMMQEQIIMVRARGE